MEGERLNQEEREPKPQAWVEFGGPGHPGEYLLSLEDCGLDRFIPKQLEVELGDALGEDWYVSNRGTRIEIVNQREYGKRDDGAVMSAVRRVLATHGYLLTES